MAGEGSEFEGVLRHRSHRGAAVDADERDDSEGYVFVERRESDESSMEDLHVVESADPSGDESGVENDGQNSESFIEVVGGGNASGDEEAVGAEIKENVRPGGSSPDEQADLRKRIEDRSLTCKEEEEEEEEEEANKLDVRSHQEPSGDHGVMDGHVQADGDNSVDSVVEKGNATLESDAEPNVVIQQLTDASLGSCTLEEDKVVVGPPGERSVDLCTEIVETRDLHLTDAQMTEEQTDPSLVAMQEFASAVTDYGSVACVESANELGCGVVVEMVDPRSGPLSEQDSKKADELTEDPNDDKSGKPESAEMAPPAVASRASEAETDNTFKGVVEMVDPKSGTLSEQDSKKADELTEDPNDDMAGKPESAEMVPPSVTSGASEAETDNTFKHSPILESCFSIEENVEAEVALLDVTTEELYSDTVKTSREAYLDDGQLPKKQIDSSYELGTLQEEPLIELVDGSTNYVKTESEQGNGAVTVLALQQGPSLKDEEHGEEMNLKDAINDKVDFQLLAASRSEFSSGLTDQEPDDIAIQPSSESWTSNEVKIEDEGILRVVTDELYPDAVKSRELSSNIDQIPRELTDSSAGIIGQSNEDPFRKEDDKINPPPNFKVEETKNAELVVEKPITVPEKEQDNSAKLSSDLDYIPIEGDKLVEELETVLAKTDEESFPEVLGSKELCARSDHLPEEEEAETVVRFQTLGDQALKEETGSSGKDEDMVRELSVGVRETSGLNQEDLRNREDESMEVMDPIIQEQKDCPLDIEMTNYTPEQDLNDTVEFPSKAGKDIETPVNEPSIEFGLKTDKNVEGESEAKVDNADIEHFEVTHIPDSTICAAIDSEQSSQVSYQNLSPSHRLRLPCDNEIENTDSNCANDLSSYPVRSVGLISQASCLGDNFVLTNRSVDDLCYVNSPMSEKFAPEAESVYAFTDGTAASNALNDDSSAHEATNVTTFSECVASSTTNTVELANQTVSAVIELQGHDPCCIKLKEEQHEDENLAGQEKEEPVVVIEEMHLTPEEVTRSLDTMAKWEPVKSSEEFEDISRNETIFSAQIDGTILECTDSNSTDYEAKESLVSLELGSEAKRNFQAVEKTQNLFGSQDQGVSKDDDNEVVSKEDCCIKDANENSAGHTTPQVTEGMEKDSRSYIIRVRRNQDDKLASQIELAQLQVEDKTQNRDAIRVMIQRKKLVCEELWKDVEDMRKEERAARQTIDAKYHELRAIRDTTSMIELVHSIDDTDDRMNSLKHRMQHETIPLKEEKQLLQKIKELKHKREDLSSKLAPQAEMQKAYEQKDQIEDHLKRLMPELDCLKKDLSQRELKAKAAKKKYDDECLILRNLQSQHRAADDLRQAAYMHLRSLRKELNEKNMHFYKYKDDARAAASIAKSGDKEALRSHCNNQIEIFMELWNKSDEFRNHYVTANQFSTVRRFGTLDGRSLGPDEEPAVLPNAPSMASNAETIHSLKSDTTRISEKKQDKRAELLSAGKSDKPLKLEISSKSDTHSKPSKRSSEDVAASVSIEESKTKDDERERRKTEETAHKRMTEELAIKQEEEEEEEKKQEARRKQQESDLKEKIRLEQIAKAKEAEERKRRKVEKAKALAEIRAQREMELKEKKRAKKERLKEKKATGSADATRETNEGPQVVANTTPEVVEIPEARDERAPTVLSKQQHYSKRKPLPPPLRNRGKRKLQTWMWVLICAVLVGLLFLLGNNALLGRLNSLGF